MKRTEQREHIFKLIFGADFNEEAEQGTQAELYFEQIEGATEKDMQYISEKAQKVVEKIDEIDAMINEHTTGWKTGRMNKVDLTILRLAVYEMKWDDMSYLQITASDISDQLLKDFLDMDSSEIVTMHIPSSRSSTPSRNWIAARLRSRKRLSAPAMTWTSFLPTSPPTAMMPNLC